MAQVKFYIGLHQPSDARWFGEVCISINRLRTRRKPLGCKEVLIDSGAFTEVARHGGYRHDVGEYAAQLRRLHEQGVANIVAAVSQDYMCEDVVLEKVLGIPNGTITPEQRRAQILVHQRLTVERYAALMACDLPMPILPALQGYDPAEYVRHLHMYGDRLGQGMWVGVGSVCKRNGDPASIVEVLAAIKTARPDLRLHGFGLKLTAIKHPGVRELLDTADSMAWSHHARKNGRNANCRHEAQAFADKIADASRLPATPWQMPLPFGYAP